MKTIRTIISEDEVPARQWLRTLCAKHRDLQIVAECSSVSETSQKLRTLQSDLLLLDIHLGPHLGFRVLDSVPGSAVPLVIMTTAYDQYAVRAFEKNAVDYLLKPVREERFAVALDRARRRLQAGLTAEMRGEIRAALEPLERLFQQGGQTPPCARVIAEREGALSVIDAYDVELIETTGNYLSLQVKGETYSTRGTLQAIEGSLPPRLFLRLNRSIMVNVKYVVRIERDADGAYAFVLQCGRNIKVGRSYRQPIAALIRSQGLLGGPLA
jgi:two-component system, LytTR family, response regulator